MSTTNFKTIAFISLSLSILATGCGDTKSGMDEDGNCNANYIEANNSVAESAKALKKYFNRDGTPTEFGKSNEDLLLKDMKVLDTKCDAFLVSYKGVDCRAILESTHSVGSSDSAAKEKACKLVKDALNGIASSTTTKVEQTSIMDNFDLDQIMAIPTDSNVEIVSPTDEEATVIN